MFLKDKPYEKTFATSATLISPGTLLKGDVRSDSDLRIDGTIQGHIYCSAKIIVGPSGFVEGNISAIAADITGRVTGDISVKELLQLKGECTVEGNIMAEKLQVDPTAVFNGKCQMGAAAHVVQMTEMDVTAKAK